MKTPKSFLFRSVVKALWNNIKVVKLINKYGHSVSPNLVDEIETKYALEVIKQATRKPSHPSSQCNASGVQVHCRPDGGR